MYLFLLDLCILLNLLAIKYIFICIGSLTKTTVSTDSYILLLHTIAAYSETLILLVFDCISL